jgi:hypothetical protein
MTPIDDRLSSSRAVVRSGIFNLAGFGVSALYMILLVPIVLFYLGREQYGLWTAVLAITGYIGLADLGVSTSFVTYIARYVANLDYRQAGQVVHLACCSISCHGGHDCAQRCSRRFLFSMLRIPPGTLPVARSAISPWLCLV